MFNNLLQSASSTCQRLEDITIFTEFYEITFTEWNAICEFLVNPRRCPRLRKLTIHVSDCNYFAIVVRLLKNSEGMQELRSRPGMEVVIVNDCKPNIAKNFLCSCTDDSGL